MNLKQLQERPTGISYPGVRESGVGVELVEGESLPLEPLGLRAEHELSLTARVRFLANDQEYQHARKVAERQLRHEFHKDIISQLYEALNLTNERDTRVILSKLLEELLQ